MFLVWGSFCGRHLCAGAARQQPSRACWGEAICEGGGHPPTCSGWKFFCTLLGSNLLELLVMFAFSIEIWNLWQSWYLELEWSTWQWYDNHHFDTAILITRLGCLFGTFPSKLRISAWDWRQHLRAFRHAGGELKSDMRAIEITFDSYSKAQKLSILAFRMQKRFCNTRKLKRTKAEKKIENRKRRVEVLDPENFVECKNCHLACQDDVVLVSSNRRFPRLLLKRSEVLRLSGQKTLPKAGTDVVRGVREARKRIHVWNLPIWFSVCQQVVLKMTDSFLLLQVFCFSDYIPFCHLSFFPWF